MRLNKYIAETGMCSRRKADQWIKEGRVVVNGKKPEMGQQVHDDDQVLIDGKAIKAKPKKFYIALYKPVGITSTTDLKDPTNIVDYMKYPERIFHIGRLDKDSEGLILMTNDGDIVNEVLRAENGHEKEYIVKVNRPITEDFLKAMASGVEILDTETLPCKIKKINPVTFNIILTQGLNRQIRRMCDALDYKVLNLKRIRIMNIHLKDLAYGKWRYLSNSETDFLKKP
jgi:23S rRNA pseudouridine2604 synthase